MGEAAVAELDLERYRAELTGFCYRMLGSGSEAEDAVQEAMIRAWRAAEGFEGRASVRSWLYRIATNVCIDMGRQVQRRARATLTALPADSRPGPLDDETGDLLERYVDAFERYDMAALRVLLHDDAVQTMPPFAMWLRGPEAITTFMVQPGPSACRGSRLLATSANGCPAFAQYKPDPDGGYVPWAIQVLEVVDGRIAWMSFFLAPLDPRRLFGSFGFAPHLDGDLRPDR